MRVKGGTSTCREGAGGEVREGGREEEREGGGEEEREEGEEGGREGERLFSISLLSPQVVVKFLRKSSVLKDCWITDEEMGNVPLEISLLARLAHPNIVQVCVCVCVRVCVHAIVFVYVCVCVTQRPGHCAGECICY